MAKTLDELYAEKQSLDGKINYYKGEQTKASTDYMTLTNVVTELNGYLDELYALCEDGAAFEKGEGDFVWSGNLRNKWDDCFYDIHCGSGAKLSADIAVDRDEAQSKATQLSVDLQGYQSTLSSLYSQLDDVNKKINNY